MPITKSCVAIFPGRFGSVYAYGNGVGTFTRAGSLYLACSNPGYQQGGGWSSDPSGTSPPVLAQAHILVSRDQGATWDELDSGNAPSVSLFKSVVSFRGLTSPIGACYLDANTLLVGYFVWDYVHNSPTELRFSTFDLITETWGAEVSGGPTSTTVSNLSMAYRASDGAIIFEYDGLENVGGTNYSRLFYAIYNAGWGAQTPIDLAQTGSTTNYNIGGVVSGDGNRTHLFYRVSDQPDVPLSDSVLWQNTLTSLDALVGAVQITTQVDTSSGQVPPRQAPWSFAVNRVSGGLTFIYIAYVKITDLKLYFQGAQSANTPVFAEQLIGSAVCQNAGIFNAGFTFSRGLVASTLENSSDLVATGSSNEVTWEATTPIPVPPDPSGPSLQNYLGLGIDAGSGGYDSAGILVNGLFSPPE